MPPPYTRAEHKEFQSLVSEVHRVTSLLELMKDDIQKNKHNVLLLVGLLTNRIMTFVHVADEYGKLLQLNPAHFDFSVNLLKKGCENIDNFFWDKLNQFEQQFCSQPHFFKSINWDAARKQLNSILQTVFHILSAIDGTVNTLRREVERYRTENNSSKNELKTEFLKCMDALKSLVVIGKNKYLSMPNVQQLISLIQPIKSITPTTTPSCPTLVAC